MVQYHFIGIGGIGMGKLASLLLSQGKTVSGSDISENAMVKSLREQGAQVTIGHHAKNLQDAECVVYSSAIRTDNPEFVSAQEKGCRIIKRAKLLAELMKDSQMITVSGAHGKTTTTSMIAHLLTHAGMDPTVALGGVFNQGSYREQLGDGKYFVAELDESDGSFLFFSPQISVITNIDLEHLDYYHDWEAILQAYRQFVFQTASDGMILGCGDNGPLRELLESSGRIVMFYGASDNNHLSAGNMVFRQGRMAFQCREAGRVLGEISLAVPGRHNVLNALACVGVGLRLGLAFPVMQDALASYGGVRRRFERKGQWGDIILFDDYAHHPTEIRATLETARAFSPKRIIAVFQPHRYTRTKFLWHEFSNAFDHADQVIITDIYAASEQVIAGVNAVRLSEDMSAAGLRHVEYISKDKITEEVVGRVQPGDLIVTLGAGDVTKICGQIAQGLEERFAVKE